MVGKGHPEFGFWLTQIVAPAAMWDIPQITMHK
jgi:hypothetical protein